MKSAIRITFFFALFSIIWIVTSDKVVTLLFSSPQAIEAASTLKGALYVAITSALLYLMVSNEIKRKNSIIGELDKGISTREQLIRELHHRIKNNLQVVIGLLNIETRNEALAREATERISNKLISMMSVFNIIYDMKDLEDISLPDDLWWGCKEGKSP